MCLEEMLLCDIPTAFIFYDEIKRRIEVEITDKLRDQVRSIFKQMHHYFDKRHTPKVKTGKHCTSCSLQNLCMPELMESTKVRRYMERYL